MTKNCCKKCEAIKYVKSGFVRGLQRYQCHECGGNFIHTKRRGIRSLLEHLELSSGICGVSMYKIAKLLGVSDVAALKWVRKEADIKLKMFLLMPKVRSS
jgi:transposase-like protein